MEFYVIDSSNSVLKEDSVIISGELYKHLAVVLRKKLYDIIELTDGNGNIYECEIVYIDRKTILCHIKNNFIGLNEPELKIRLFISPLRNLNRFEFAIEKTVELGVYEIYPVKTKHTVLKEKFSEIRYHRVNKIIKSAVGQSQRCYIPIFHNLITFDELMSITSDCKQKIVMYEHSNEEQIEHFKIQNNCLDLLIGPEGGFDLMEISKLIEFGWNLGSLGKRKLRAETAAIVSVFKLLNL